MFLKTIGDQEIFENETAKFKAIVTGTPLPEFQWLKDSVKVLQDSRSVVERDRDGIIRLTISKVGINYKYVSKFLLNNRIEANMEYIVAFKVMAFNNSYQVAKLYQFANIFFNSIS